MSWSLLWSTQLELAQTRRILTLAQDAEMEWFQSHKGLGEGVQRSILTQRDRLARVDINHYGFGTLDEVQLFASFLPKRVRHACIPISLAWSTQPHTPPAAASWVGRARDR
jgi:hypothetical protein